MLTRISRHQYAWQGCLFLLICAILLNAIQSFRAIDELVHNESRASTTKSVLQELTNLYSRVQDAELGMRGYLLTNNLVYLDPYYESLVPIENGLETLAQFNYERVEQRQRVEELKRIINIRLQEMAGSIDDHQRSHTKSLTSGDIIESRQSMRELRELVRAMETMEYHLLDEQSVDASESRQSLSQTIIVANTVGLIMVFLAGLLLRHILKVNQKESEKLEKMVQQRTNELQHYSNELQRSNRELQDFAFVASHDLQEPLRKIRAFGDRLKSRYAEPLGDGADYVERMQSAASRMSALIEDLLEFSRVSTRSNPFQEVDLNQTLGIVMDNLEVSIQERQAVINIAELPIIEADPGQMTQLFQNLLGNAIKFVESDVRPEIRVDVENTVDEQGNPEFIITVTDNGIGFDEKYADKIFTPFQRLHGRDRYAGTGIGLAICRRIVERHQGILDVKSEPGAGSSFIITLHRNLQVSMLGGHEVLAGHEVLTDEESTDV